MHLAEGAGKRIEKEEMQQECNQIQSYLQVTDDDYLSDVICNEITGKDIDRIRFKLSRYTAEVPDKPDNINRYGYANKKKKADYRKDLIKRLLPFLVAKYQKEAKETNTLEWLVFGVPLLLFLIINWYFG